MNTNDKKDALLLEIINIYEDTIKTILKTSKKKDGKIKLGINKKHTVVCLYLVCILIYLICFIPYIFCNNIIYTLLILFGTVLFVIVYKYEQYLPNKEIKNKTGVDYDATYFDLFMLNIEKYNSDNLKFLCKYIKFLTSKKTNINIFINIYLFSFIIAFVVNNLTGNIGKIEDPYFFQNIMGSLAIGFIGIVVFNIIRNLYSYKNIKYLKIKRFIKYTLLCRKIEKISNGNAD